MYTIELQFLGRAEGDYECHLEAATRVRVRGRIGFRSYHFGGRPHLIVRLDDATDIKAIVDALPREAYIGTRRLSSAPRDIAA